MIRDLQATSPRDALAVEAGLDFWQSPDAALGTSYSGQVAKDAKAHAVQGASSV